jgi:hypothetical protein
VLMQLSSTHQKKQNWPNMPYYRSWCDWISNVFRAEANQTRTWKCLTVWGYQLDPINILHGYIYL